MHTHAHTHTHTLTLTLSHTLLTQGVDSGVEETIRESCQHLHESLDTVTCLTGQISLGRKLVGRRVCAHLHPTEEGGGEEWRTLDNLDDFLSVQVRKESSREERREGRTGGKEEGMDRKNKKLLGELLLSCDDIRFLCYKVYMSFPLFLPLL